MADRGVIRPSVWTSTPSTPAALSRAVSVGSPTYPSSGPWRASLHSAPATRTSWASRRASGSPPPVAPGTWAPAAVTTFCTVCRFMVSVPVLSVQMVVVLPRVSTAGRRRTMAPRRAIRVTPIARVMVTTAGRPSGMAATARATAAVTICTSGCPRKSPTTTATAARPRMPAVSTRPKPARLRVSGVVSGSALPMSPCTRPSSVSMPWATTTPRAPPRVTNVPDQAMFARSARSVSSGSSSSALLAGSDSPVRVDSSTDSSSTWARRRSAGTRSPSASRTRSPGTT